MNTTRQRSNVLGNKISPDYLFRQERSNICGYANKAFNKGRKRKDVRLHLKMFVKISEEMACFTENINRLQ